MPKEKQGGWARAGAGIRVTKERLIPLGASGGFFAIGLLSFVAIPFWTLLLADPISKGMFIHPHVIALVHLYVLGLGTAVALGALPQLSVVLFQAPEVKKPGLGLSVLAVFFVGLMVLIGGMSLIRYDVAGIGGLLVLGALLMTIWMVLQAVRQGDRASLVAPFITVALGALTLAMMVGALLTLQRATGLLGSWRMNALVSHVYLGPVGWFGFLIPGISYELAPFFGLTRSGDDKGLGRLEKPVFYLLVFGMVGGLMAALFDAYHPAWLGPLAVGYLVFAFDLRGLFASRPPVRRTAILTGVRAGQLSLVGIFVMLVVGVIRPELWAEGRWLTAFGWLALGGWVTNNVIGYLHRILPFLIWHARYWGVSKEDVRTRFPEMVSQRRGRVGFCVYNVGLAMGIAGLWLGSLLWTGLVLLALGTVILFYNLAQSYFR